LGTVVILRAPDIGMRDHGGDSGVSRQGLLVEIVLENRCETLVRTRRDVQGSPAGGFEAVLAIAFAQVHDASTRAETLLGMRPGGQEGCDDACGGLSRLCRPEDTPLWSPCRILLVSLGHVGGHRAVTTREG